MANILFTYNDKKELIIVPDDGYEKRYLKGKELNSIFSKLLKDNIQSIILEGNKMTINYDTYNVIILDTIRFLKDKDLLPYQEYLSKYSQKDNKYILDLIKQSKYTQEEKNRKARFKGIVRGASLTGLGLSVLISASLIYNNTFNQSKHDFERIEISDDYFIAQVNDNQKIYLNYETTNDNRFYSYIKNNYGEIISKYAKNYGIDEKIIIAMAANGMQDYKTAPNEYGLCQLDFNKYVNNSVASYNYKLGGYELYPISKEKLDNLETYFKISCMIFESNLRRCNYNFIAAIESMHVGEETFRERILQYGQEIYGFKANPTKEEENEYFNFIMSYLEDFSYLEKFRDEEGNIYVYEVLSNFSTSKTFEFKKVDKKDNIENIAYEVENSQIIKKNIM